MLKVAWICPFSRRLSTSSAARQSNAGWKRSRDRRFVDWRKVHVYGGSGGDGCMSFRKRAKPPFGGPEGGNGGSGGGVVFVADPSVKTLDSVKAHYRGEHGGCGKRARQTGRTGQDVVVKVPPGTVIKEYPAGVVLADLMRGGDSCTVASGGEGGLGNALFASPGQRRPRDFTKGEAGEERVVEVELKTIADVGMVGFPNAGKSTLLRAISRATPTVAAYPFTTLNPHIGVVEGPSGEQIAVADIPGLIPGAHLNKGLGHSFLRHIERCKALLYVVDTSTSEPSVITQLHHLQTELRLYRPSLCENVSLIVANKMDLVEKDRGKLNLEALQQCVTLPIIPVSALQLWNIENLKLALWSLCTVKS